MDLAGARRAAAGADDARGWQASRSQPDFSYSRVLDGFSASLDPRAVSLLEHDAEVAGVYPVRAAFPASTSQRLSRHESRAARGRAARVRRQRRHDRAARHRRRPRASLPPRARRAGIDLVSGGDDASAHAEPAGPVAARAARHRDGRASCVARRRARRDACCRSASPAGSRRATGPTRCYGRSDQLIAGLDRAVDPNGDGDAHDAVRVALVGVAEPYAAFADEARGAGRAGRARPEHPRRRARRERRRRRPVVRLGRGPGRRAGRARRRRDRLAAAARQRARRAAPRARRAARQGAAAARRRRAGARADARRRNAARRDGRRARSFFDESGNSLVAGKAAVIPLGSDPQAAASAAAAAGARAVLLYGPAAPPGALRIAETLDVPVAWIPDAPPRRFWRRSAPASTSASRSAAGIRRPTATAASSRASRRAASPSTAASSRTSRRRASRSRPPSRARRPTARRSTAPSTARAARRRRSRAPRRCSSRCGPRSSATQLRSLLVGYAQRGGAPATQAGAGTFRVGASAVGECPPTRRRSASASGRERSGTRRARSSSATSPRGGCRCP